MGGEPATSRVRESLGSVPPAVPPTFNNQTLRQIVHTSIGGKQVRVRLSNLFGTGDLLVGAARIGLRSGDAQILPNTNKVLTFSGRSAVTIPAGALVISDPVTLPVPALGDLSVSIYLPNSVSGYDAAHGGLADQLHPEWRSDRGEESDGGFHLPVLLLPDQRGSLRS